MNVNLKSILSIHVALQYISKYASKKKFKLIVFSKIFNQILNNSNSINTLLIPIQKLLLSSIIEQDMSAQETYHFY